jgi:hypothetical protein
MIACPIFNGLETAGTIVRATMKQRHVPASTLGRVSGLDWLTSNGLLPLSCALTAPVAGLVDARATLVGVGVIGGRSRPRLSSRRGCTTSRVKRRRRGCSHPVEPDVARAAACKERSHLGALLS